MKNIVILGAGVGGIRTALDLEKKVRNLEDVKITVIDHKDYTEYTHRIHEVAGGRTKEYEIVVPLSKIFEGKKINFLKTVVDRIDLKNKVVKTDIGDIPYDFLVIALGSETEFYSLENVKRSSLELKDVADAILIRELVKQIVDSISKKKDGSTNIVIGGCGFTGVELAGELAEYVKKLCEERGIDFDRVKVKSVEALSHVLPGWDKELSDKVYEHLKKLGIDVITGHCIVNNQENCVILDNNTNIENSLLIWTCGVRGSSVLSKSGLEVGKGNRAIINDYCEAVGHKEVYVVGDCSLVLDPITKKPIPPNAHIAMEQGKIVAYNIYAELKGLRKKKYTPKHVGEIVTVGKDYAVGKLWGISMSGTIAKIFKKLIHLMYVYSIGGFKLLLAGKDVGKEVKIMRKEPKVKKIIMV